MDGQVQLTTYTIPAHHTTETNLLKSPAVPLYLHKLDYRWYFLVNCIFLAKLVNRWDDRGAKCFTCTAYSVGNCLSLQARSNVTELSGTSTSAARFRDRSRHHRGESNCPSCKIQVLYSTLIDCRTGNLIDRGTLVLRRKTLWR